MHFRCFPICCHLLYQDGQVFSRISRYREKNSNLAPKLLIGSWSHDLFFSRRLWDRGDAVPRVDQPAGSPAKVPLHTLRHDVTIQLHNEASHAQNVNKLSFLDCSWRYAHILLFWSQLMAKKLWSKLTTVGPTQARNLCMSPLIGFSQQGFKSILLAELPRVNVAL